jgi:hypothetical protein
VAAALVFAMLMVIEFFGRSAQATQMITGCGAEVLLVSF